MKYLGSKFLIGKQIADYIREDTQYKMFFSPFCGALGVERHLVKDFEINILNDISTDLIMFLQDLHSNRFLYPLNVLEEDYNKLKSEPSSSLRCFVGYFLSFGGKWFGGYAQKYQRGDKVRDFLKEAKDSSERLRNDLKDSDIIFDNKSYDEFSPYKMTIYCDPPYENTTGYGKFDHTLFWETMRKWSENNDVYISSYDAPEDFECVWETPKRVTVGHDKSKVKYERLFKLKKI
jgi:DNA adenine methylase